MQQGITAHLGAEPPSRRMPSKMQDWPHLRPFPAERTHFSLWAPEDVLWDCGAGSGKGQGLAPKVAQTQLHA